MDLGNTETASIPTPLPHTDPDESKSVTVQGATLDCGVDLERPMPKSETPPQILWESHPAQTVSISPLANIDPDESESVLKLEPAPCPEMDPENTNSDSVLCQIQDEFDSAQKPSEQRDPFPDLILLTDTDLSFPTVSETAPCLGPELDPSDMRDSEDPISASEPLQIDREPDPCRKELGSMPRPTPHPHIDSRVKLGSDPCPDTDSENTKSTPPELQGEPDTAEIPSEQPATALTSTTESEVDLASPAASCSVSCVGQPDLCNGMRSENPTPASEPHQTEEDPDLVQIQANTPLPHLDSQGFESVPPHKSDATQIGLQPEQPAPVSLTVKTEPGLSSLAVLYPVAYIRQEPGVVTLQSDSQGRDRILEGSRLRRLQPQPQSLPYFPPIQPPTYSPIRPQQSPSISNGPCPMICHSILIPSCPPLDLPPDFPSYHPQINHNCPQPGPNRPSLAPQLRPNHPQPPPDLQLGPGLPGPLPGMAGSIPGSLPSQPPTTQAWCRGESFSSRGVFENYRWWQNLRDMARKIYPDSGPDAEALACFFIPVIRSFCLQYPSLLFTQGISAAVGEWRKLSNYDRMEYYHLAQKFVELEVEEVTAKERSKVIQRSLSGTGQSGAQAELKAGYTGKSSATTSAKETETKSTTRVNQAKDKTQRATKSGSGPRVPHGGRLGKVDIKVLEERALGEYTAAMEALLIDPAGVRERLEVRGQEEEGDKEEEGEGDGECSFTEYLNELCSQREFVTKVEAVLDLQYLSSLLTFDPDTIDLLAQEEAQVDQEMPDVPASVTSTDPEDYTTHTASEGCTTQQLAPSLTEHREALSLPMTSYELQFERHCMSMSSIHRQDAFQMCPPQRPRHFVFSEDSPEGGTFVFIPMGDYIPHNAPLPMMMNSPSPFPFSERNQTFQQTQYHHPNNTIAGGPLPGDLLASELASTSTTSGELNNLHRPKSDQQNYNQSGPPTPIGSPAHFPLAAYHGGRRMLTDNPPSCPPNLRLLAMAALVHSVSSTPPEGQGEDNDDEGQLNWKPQDPCPFQLSHPPRDRDRVTPPSGHWDGDTPCAVPVQSFIMAVSCSTPKGDPFLDAHLTGWVRDTPNPAGERDPQPPPLWAPASLSGPTEEPQIGEGSLEHRPQLEEGPREDGTGRGMEVEAADKGGKEEWRVIDSSSSDGPNTETSDSFNAKMLDCVNSFASDGNNAEASDMRNSSQASGLDSANVKALNIIDLKVTNVTETNPPDNANTQATDSAFVQATDTTITEAPRVTNSESSDSVNEKLTDVITATEASSITESCDSDGVNKPLPDSPAIDCVKEFADLSTVPIITQVDSDTESSPPSISSTDPGSALLSDCVSETVEEAYPRMEETWNQPIEGVNLDESMSDSQAPIPGLLHPHSAWDESTPLPLCLDATGVKNDHLQSYMSRDSTRETANISAAHTLLTLGQVEVEHSLTPTPRGSAETEGETVLGGYKGQMESNVERENGVETGEEAEMERKEEPQPDQGQKTEADRETSKQRDEAKDKTEKPSTMTGPMRRARRKSKAAAKGKEESSKTENVAEKEDEAKRTEKPSFIPSPMITTRRKSKATEKEKEKPKPENTTNKVTSVETYKEEDEGKEERSERPSPLITPVTRKKSKDAEGKKEGKSNTKKETGGETEKQGDEESTEKPCPMTSTATRRMIKTRGNRKAEESKKEQIPHTAKKEAKATTPNIYTDKEREEGEDVPTSGRVALKDPSPMTRTKWEKNDVERKKEKEPRTANMEIDGELENKESEKIEKPGLRTSPVTRARRKDVEGKKEEKPKPAEKETGKQGNETKEERTEKSFPITSHMTRSRHAKAAMAKKEQEEETANTAEEETGKHGDEVEEHLTEKLKIKTIEGGGTIENDTFVTNRGPNGKGMKRKAGESGDMGEKGERRQVVVQSEEGSYLGLKKLTTKNRRGLTEEPTTSYKAKIEKVETDAKIMGNEGTTENKRQEETIPASRTKHSEGKREIETVMSPVTERRTGKIEGGKRKGETVHPPIPAKLSKLEEDEPTQAGGHTPDERREEVEPKRKEEMDRARERWSQRVGKR
ncbi:hypothetical protein J4Q44_G00376250 [Coregonus suidteri]|uniref:Nuclear Testis protein N-terminal domain-containing protein n=1 Tax=Coregonus suidteri TaxID=861788 RepID=A0AAN8KMJ2_9TELE